MNTSTLFVLPENSHTGNSFLSRQYILRHCNLDYRNVTSLYNDSEKHPEFDCNKVPGKVAPFLSFDNEYGHWFKKPAFEATNQIEDMTTRVFEPIKHPSLENFVQYIKLNLEHTLQVGRIWDMDNTAMIKYSSVRSSPTSYPDDFVYVAMCQDTCQYNPISVHPVQAYVESSEKRGKGNSIYRLPRQSTINTGPHGGLHNNQQVEMGFEEKNDSKDIQKRTFNPEWTGYYCRTHTAHSGDAGKSRRLCSFTRVRVPSKTILDTLLNVKDDVPNDGDWIVYCMGSTFRTDNDGVWTLVYQMHHESKDYYMNQFVDQNVQSMTCPASYMVYEREKILYISVSAGTILRSLPDDSMIDWSMMYRQKPNTIIEHVPIPVHGTESIPYVNSTFFLMVPYMEHNRPPRTLFASGQTTQAIFFPWAPATARVSPLHASRPIVATQFIRDMEKDQNENLDAIWDIFPGEDMTICYMNMELNYEDSMVVSSKFSDMGGFATLSVCTYRISESDQIPEVGETLCGKKYKWWKVDCKDNCVCKPKYKRGYISSSGRIPSGKVNEIIRTEDGQISIKVLSFSQLLSGDKISTMHGQKGVVRIVPYEDLPTIVLKDGSIMVADLYMAVGSVLPRQTNGQIYESEAGLQSARNGHICTVDKVMSTDTEECDYIINSVTGHIIMKQGPSGKVSPVHATIGITRIINQTQMTRERHHLTHRPEGKYSTGTKAGRADGGGVALSEMDFHAMFSSGLYGCAQELIDRGNMCIVPVCRHCNAIQPNHDCDNDDGFVNVLMPYDSAVFDQISASLNGSCNRYYIEHV